MERAAPSLVETLEMRGMEKSQPGQATYPKSHSQERQSELNAGDLVTSDSSHPQRCTQAHCLAYLDSYIKTSQGSYH